MVAPHNLRVPSSSDKDGLDTARDGGREDVGDLEADEERERQDNGGVLALRIVGGIGELQIQVGKKGASVSDEEGAK